MIFLDLTLHWITVAFYAISSIVYIISSNFKKNYLQTATTIALLGFVTHTAALGVRWEASGHLPYMGRYEIASSLVWTSMLFYLFFQRKKRGLANVGFLFLPFSLIMLGVVVMSDPQHKEIPESFDTLWLLVHVIFAKLAYGSCLLGTALGFLYIVKEKQPDWLGLTSILDRLPSKEVADEYSHKFIGFGFIMIGIMIASGSIWANSSWGSYWSWDPVEVWSLISWAIYGLYLHFRRIHGWRGGRAAWFSLFAFLVLLFTLLGVGLIYVSEHAPYIS
ncbi:MAG: cytochrome c biogenesis protein CcsA [Thermincolia bacterium]